MCIRDSIKAAMNRRYLALSLEEKKVYYLKAFPAATLAFVDAEL